MVAECSQTKFRSLARFHAIVKKLRDIANSRKYGWKMRLRRLAIRLYAYFLTFLRVLRHIGRA